MHSKGEFWMQSLYVPKYVPSLPVAPDKRSFYFMDELQCNVYHTYGIFFKDPTRLDKLRQNRQSRQTPTYPDNSTKISISISIALRCSVASCEKLASGPISSARVRRVGFLCHFSAKNSPDARIIVLFPHNFEFPWMDDIIGVPESFLPLHCCSVGGAFFQNDFF